MNDRIRKLYTALTNDNIEHQSFWSAFKKSAVLRNKIAHNGKIASKQEARDSYKAASAFITHFHKNWRCHTMSTKELLDEAMKLKPEERFTLVEGLIKSLDEPDKKLDEMAEESEKRLKAYREGKLQGIPMEEIFKEA